MANTTNFGWETPDDTDLVKDGAAAIRTVAGAIDTSLVDLKGGTTNQVLAKNSNTDMDFKWVADAAGMTNPMTTTGDTIYSSSGSTPARLGIGSTGDVLTVAGGVPSWAAPAGSGSNWSLHNAGGTALTGAQTITVSGISSKDKIMVLIKNASSVNATKSEIKVRLNTDTGNNYYRFGGALEGLNTYSSAYLGHEGGAARDGILAGQTGTNALSAVSGCAVFTGCASAGVKQFTVVGSSDYAEQIGVFAGGYYDSASSITSVSLFSDDGNFDAGTLFVYTSA